MSTDFSVEKYNQELKQWQQRGYAAFKAQIASLGMKGKTELLRMGRNPAAIQRRIELEGLLKKNLKRGKLGKESGEIVSIGFKFPRHGIFVAYGVGKGRPISSPKNAKDWWGPWFSANVPLLAARIAEYKASYIVKSAVRNFDKSIKTN